MAPPSTSTAPKTAKMPTAAVAALQISSLAKLPLQSSTGSTSVLSKPSPNPAPNTNRPELPATASTSVNLPAASNSSSADTSGVATSTGSNTKPLEKSL